jgi:hypothetical protein
MSRPFDPVAFGARLNREIERAGITDVKALQRELQKRTSQRGTSYASVWSYVNGQAPSSGPRQAVVEALASIFGVLPTYLLHGGHRTPTDATADEKGAVALNQEKPTWPEVDQLFTESFPGGEVMRGPGAAARAQLWRLWAASRWLRSIVAHVDGQEEDGHRALAMDSAQQVVRAVLAPLKEIDALPPRPIESGSMAADTRLAHAAGMWGDRLDSYIITTCETLLFVIKRQQEGLARSFRPFAEKASENAEEGEEE